MANGALLYEVRDHVARVTINRPDRRNAMSWDVITGLRKAAADAKEDDDVRVVVLTGAGEQAFCAGADLTGMTGDRGFAKTHDARGELARLFLVHNKPFLQVQTLVKGAYDRAVAEARDGEDR